MFIINMLFYILVGLVLDARAVTLPELEQKFNALVQKVGTLEQNSEAKFNGIQNQLEYGGKKYETLKYTTSKYIAS